MSTIKKVFAEVYAFLTDNEGAKVKTIMPQLEAIMSAKARGAIAGATRMSIRDADNRVVAILDYQFKRWMPLIGERAVEFGQKLGTATGLNPMSKAGVAAWTKAQRVAKDASAALITRIANGELQPSDIPAEQAAIEAARVTTPETTLGFATYDEVLAYLVDNGVSIAVAEPAVSEEPAV